MKKILQALLLCPLLLAAADKKPAKDNLIILDAQGVKNLRLELTEATEADFEQTILALGRIAVFPGNLHVVSSRIPGRALTVKVKPDQTVKQGEELVTLESRQPGDPPPSITLIAPMTGMISNLTTAPGKPMYLDDSVNAASGDNIQVPATAAGIWAELNQHQGELVDGIAEKKYEAIDEVTRAYPKLAKGLPAQSGEKQAAAQTLVDTLVKHLAAVREASATRKLDDAKPGMEGIATTLTELKKLYPEDIANAKLAE